MAPKPEPARLSKESTFCASQVYWTRWAALAAAVAALAAAIGWIFTIWYPVTRALSRLTSIIGGVAAGASAGVATLHFCEKCEVAHTSPRLTPLKSGTRIGTRTVQEQAPGGVHGTETKTSCRRDGSCDGVDHPSGHDVGGGSPELVIDLPP